MVAGNHLAPVQTPIPLLLVNRPSDHQRSFINRLIKVVKSGTTTEGTGGTTLTRSEAGGALCQQWHGRTQGGKDGPNK